jgi:hypothetical protein
LDRVADIQVLLDGQPISDAVFMPYVFSSGETNWGVGVYFDLFSSGTHQIQLQTIIRLDDEIGDDSVFLTLNNLARTIVVDNEVTFNRYGGSRPYRFVWLDGCSTANGNWPGAFGVDKAAYDLGHYTNSVSNPKHRRPSAFVGWNRPVGTGGVWGNAQNAYNFRSEWMQKWYYSWQTEGLYLAFQEASQSANWPPSGEPQLFDAMQVYGYTNLLMNGYNQKNDWRWP